MIYLVKNKILLKKNEHELENGGFSVKIFERYKTILDQSPKLSPLVFKQIMSHYKIQDVTNLSQFTELTTIFQKICKIEPARAKKCLDILEKTQPYFPKYFLFSSSRSFPLLLKEIVKADPSLLKSVLIFAQDAGGYESNASTCRMLSDFVEASPKDASVVLQYAMSLKSNENTKPLILTFAACLKHISSKTSFPKNNNAYLLPIASKIKNLSSMEQNYALDYLDIQELPYDFFQKAAQCGQIIQKAALNEKIPNPYLKTPEFISTSFTTAKIFTPQELKRYLQSFQTFGQSIVEALCWLPKDFNAEDGYSFKNFLNKHLVFFDIHGKKHIRPVTELKTIANRWFCLNTQEKRASYKTVLSICSSIKYPGQKYASFAAEAAKFFMHEEDYKRFEKIYEKGLNVPEPFDTSKTYVSGKLTGRFLKREDPRVGFFGNYAYNCQHFTGIGKNCAISSVKDPYSQLFVIENSKGDIIAGSWVWENTKNKFRNVCFDSMEILSAHKNNPDIHKIYALAAYDLCYEQNCRRVTIGTNTNTNSGYYKETKPITFPEKYIEEYGYAYSDADRQYLLCHNVNAASLKSNTPKKSNRFSESHMQFIPNREL